MPKIDVRVLREIPEGVEVGSEPCACGGCRPTATVPLVVADLRG